MRFTAAVISSVSLLLMTACAGSPAPVPAEPTSARACAGLPSALLDQALADLRANVDQVQPLRNRSTKLTPRSIGAVVQVRATPGMTAEWLGQVLQCDAARRPSASCAAGACPLVPDGAVMAVTSTPTGFAIEVRARELELALEIQERAKQFSRPTPL